MANYLFVDNSNVWIEGMRVSAVVNGLAPDIGTAITQRILDYSWKIDFGRLYEFADGDKDGWANLYGSKPPKNDSLWANAKAHGFQVVTHDRNFANKEKKIDTTISKDMMKASYEKMKPGKDILTLVSGDADYVPVVEDLRERKFQVDVLFWAHVSGELKRTASKFVNLNAHLKYLNFNHS